MRRKPENDTMTEDEDSGSYDVRGMRGQIVDPELLDVIGKVVQKAVQKMRPQVNYSEGNNGLLKWVLGVLSSLLVALIIGIVVEYGKDQGQVARGDSFQRQLDRIETRIDRVENKIDGRSGVTRGGADDSNAR